MSSGLVAGAMIFSMLAVAAESRAQDKKTAAVDEVFSDLTKAGSPGCALGVYRDGKIVYSKGYGLANLEENVADHAAERVRHRFDVETVYGREHLAPGEAGKTVHQRRHPEIRS